jgi:hypothetical protein
MGVFRAITLFFLIAVAADAFGQAKVGGILLMSGNGCPEGTASAVFSPDGRVLSVLFDNFIAEAGVSTNKEYDQKDCVIRFPVTIAPDERLKIENAQFRGGMVLPTAPAWADLIAHFGWYSPVSKMGPNFAYRSKIWQDATNEDYTYDVDLEQPNDQGLWSPCGVQDLIFEMGARLRLHMFDAKGDALGSVDSIDATLAKERGVDFHIRSEKCSPKPPIKPPKPKPRRR